MLQLKEKHANRNQMFCAFEDYALLYWFTHVKYSRLYWFLALLNNSDRLQRGVGETFFFKKCFFCIFPDSSVRMKIKEITATSAKALIIMNETRIWFWLYWGAN